MTPEKLEKCLHERADEKLRSEIFTALQPITKMMGHDERSRVMIRGWSEGKDTAIQTSFYFLSRALSDLAFNAFCSYRRDKAIKDFLSKVEDFSAKYNELLDVAEKMHLDEPDPET